MEGKSLTVRPTVCSFVAGLKAHFAGEKKTPSLRPATEMSGGKEHGHAKKMRPTSIERALQGQFISDVLYTCHPLPSR
jgi:hypothetical protein